MATQYPSVINQQQLNNQCILTLKIPADLIYFEGHFDNEPIVAGVVQIAWVVYFGEKYIGFKIPIQDIKSIKFKRLMTPEIILDLIIEQQASTLKFSYQDQQGLFSKGVLSAST